MRPRGTWAILPREEGLAEGAGREDSEVVGMSDAELIVLGGAVAIAGQMIRFAADWTFWPGVALSFIGLGIVVYAAARD